MCLSVFTVVGWLCSLGHSCGHLSCSPSFPLLREENVLGVGGRVSANLPWKEWQFRKHYISLYYILYVITLLPCYVWAALGRRSFPFWGRFGWKTKLLEFWLSFVARHLTFFQHLEDGKQQHECLMLLLTLLANCMHVKAGEIGFVSCPWYNGIANIPEWRKGGLVVKFVAIKSNSLSLD